MKIRAAAVTNVGMVRRNNEDNYFVCGCYKESTETSNCDCSCTASSDECLFGVCDGMGGTQYGELASRIAVETMTEYAVDFDKRYADFIRAANERICREITKRGASSIGTTFAGLYIKNAVVHAYNIGDSRIYYYRAGRLFQLSVDHTQAQMLFQQGIITAQEAKLNCDRHVLTQHLGIFPEEMVIEPYCAEPFKLADGDLLLLCSDGLTDALDDDEICNVLSQKGLPEQKAQALTQTALDRGGRDNVTVVLAEAVGESTTAANGIPLTGLMKKLKGKLR